MRGDQSIGSAEQGIVPAGGFRGEHVRAQAAQLIKAPGVPKNPLVSNVRIGKMADKTRVVIDLKAKPQNTRFVLAKDGNTLDVRVDQ